MTKQFSRIDTQRFGSWALVTGASSGIGKEFASQLAANGINVVLAARRLSILDDIGLDLTRRFGIECRPVQVDVTEPAFLDTLADATRDLDLGLVISNAGEMIPGGFLDIDEDVLLRDLRLNAESHLSLIHYFGQRLANRGRGGILLVSSTAGMQGVPYAATYSAAKSYLFNLGEAVHHELSGRGVSVTVLAPGATDTALAAKLEIDKTPMRRMLMSVEQCVAEGLAALSGDRATHIPGRINRIMTAMIPRRVATKMLGSVTGQLVQRRAARPTAAAPGPVPDTGRPASPARLRSAGSRRAAPGAAAPAAGGIEDGRGWFAG